MVSQEGQVRSKGQASVDKLQVAKNGSPAAHPVSLQYAVDYSLANQGWTAMSLTGWFQLRDKMNWVANWDLWSATRWTDIATFQFRLKLGGVKDYGRKFDTWQGVAWSNPIKVTVQPRK